MTSSTGQSSGAAKGWTRLGVWKYWWLPLAIAVVFMLAGSAALGAVNKQVSAMHVPGTSGRSVQGFLGRSHLDDAVRQWKAFWDPSNLVIRDATHQGYKSPQWLATLFMILDFGLVIPGYVVTTLVVMARNQDRLRPERAYLKRVLAWSAVGILVVGFLDIVENTTTLILLHGYWNGTHERGWLDGLLGIAATGKWLVAFGVIFGALILTITRLRDASQATRTAVRLLRVQIAVAVGVLALFKLPFQLVDLMLRITAMQALLIVLFTVVLAAAMWSISRLIASGHEARRPIDGRLRPPRWLLVVVFGPLGLIVGSNLLTKGDAMGPLIPLLIAAVLWGLGWVLKDARSTKPLCRDLGSAGIFIPQLLAATAIALGGLASIDAAVASYVQNGGIAVTAVLSGVLFTLSLAALFGTFEIEYRLVGAHLSKVPGRRRTFENVMGAAKAPGVDQQRRQHTYALVAWVAAGLTAVTYVLLVASPITIPQDLGSVSIVMVFLAAASLVLGSLVLLADWWVDRWGLPKGLTAFDYRRIPVVTLLLVWAIAASTLDDGSHWNVRILGSSTPAANQSPVMTYPGISLTTAFDAWLSHASERAGAAEAGARTPIPLVFVAASGGGIRAAYWTALALDCLFSGHMASTAATTHGDPCAPTSGRAARPEDLFLASGASGGSVGMVEWDANRDVPYQSSWVQDRMEGDFVAPTLATGLLVEVPRSFLHYRARARDDVLEQAWERAWEGTSPNPMTQGYLAGQEARMASGGPFLVLNGSSVFDGCSLSVSLLDMGSTVDQRIGGTPPSVPLGDCKSVVRYIRPEHFSEPPGPLPGTADLVDYLGCDGNVDVRRSTAALLSARFPYISGAGRLTACGLTASTKYIDDGGIVDDSGAEPVLAAWINIEPLVEQHNATSTNSCIVPYFVQLDNGYSSTASPSDKTKPPNQLLAPIQSLLQTTGLHSRQDRARAMAADLFTQPFSLSGAAGSSTGVANRYAIIVPRGHPGLEASLGWTLSEGSRRDLESQLYNVNAAAIRDVRGWLEHPPACPTASG
jgi:hypothetical protein